MTTLNESVLEVLSGQDLEQIDELNLTAADRSNRNAKREINILDKRKEGIARAQAKLTKESYGPPVRKAQKSDKLPHHVKLASAHLRQYWMKHTTASLDREKMINDPKFAWKAAAAANLFHKASKDGKVVVGIHQDKRTALKLAQQHAKELAKNGLKAEPYATTAQTTKGRKGFYHGVKLTEAKESIHRVQSTDGTTRVPKTELDPPFKRNGLQIQNKGRTEAELIAAHLRYEKQAEKEKLAKAASPYGRVSAFIKKKLAKEEAIDEVPCN